MEKAEIVYSDEFILIVDDDEAFGKLLIEMLAQLGFKVHYVSNSLDALEELKKKQSYTFMLTDINMPGIDGLDLLKNVKNGYPHVCSISMTGYSEKYKYVDVIDAGAVDFIKKPFDIEELEAKFKRAIIERDIRQELKKLSITDPLTGLYNRRHFHNKLEEEIIRAQRQKKKLGLMLLDLDNFKEYNDRHGHLAGDKMLKHFGEIIKSQIRLSVDSGYRYGGDEFVLILIDADTYVSQRIGKRILKVFKKECNQSVSIGYASLSDNMNAEDIIAEADKMLYKEKIGK